EVVADPLREIEVYRSVLAGAGLGTAKLYAADVERSWLVLEKVEGVELYQIGELDPWQRALRWLARMHDRFAGADLPDVLLRPARGRRARARPGLRAPPPRRAVARMVAGLGAAAGARAGFPRAGAARRGEARPVTRTLIVNADDLGLSAGVNRGIARAHADGI